MLKLAIFDMDGLILDSERIYLEEAKKVSDTYHYHIPKEAILATMGLNSAASHQKIIDYMGKDFPIDEYLEHLHEGFEYRLMHREVAKKKGLMELLQYLDEHHILKAVATSTKRIRAEAMLKNANIYDRFDCIVCGNEIANSKPAPDIYQKVLKNMGIRCREAVVFEDSRNGLLSACNADIPCILVPDLAVVEEELQKRALAVVKDLSKAIDILDDIY